MNSTTSFFTNSSTGTVCISIEEFENLIACKKELIQIKKDLKQFLGDDL